MQSQYILFAQDSFAKLTLVYFHEDRLGTRIT